jgi:hypothetical protein
VLRFRIGFNADLDPAIFVKADANLDTDPDPGFDDQKLKKENLKLKNN